MDIDTARLLARYNTKANTDMNAVLATLTDEQWRAPRGGYFPSFQSLTGHVYTADVHWLVRFSGHRAFAAVHGEPFDFPPSWNEPPFGSFAEYQQLRTQLDAKIQAWATELTPADLAVDLEYRNSRGDSLTKSFGGLVLHVFNHQTHHRGMVALYLDQLGIANDFSNITSLL